MLSLALDRPAPPLPSLPHSIAPRPAPLSRSPAHPAPPLLFYFPLIYCMDDLVTPWSRWAWWPWPRRLGEGVVPVMVTPSATPSTHTDCAALDHFDVAAPLIGDDQIYLLVYAAAPVQKFEKTNEEVNRIQAWVHTHRGLDKSSPLILNTSEATKYSISKYSEEPPALCAQRETNPSSLHEHCVTSSVLV